jgi:hypothetical protein
MTRLADYIAISRPDLRSVSLERDLGSDEPLKSYSPPIAALQLLAAINRAGAAGPRLRAWSLIGPYGVGKSTFAHLLAGLLGPKDELAYTSARRAVRSADEKLAAALARTRGKTGLGSHGAVLACVTAGDERLSTSLARALEAGAEGFWNGRPGRRPRALSVLNGLSGGADRTRSRRVIEAFDALAETAPVLVVIDEFGRILENEANAEPGELYALQLLAERMSNSSQLLGWILTLQHLSLEESTSGLPPASRAEWRKVEGRFEPRVFDADPSHAVSLIGRALDQRSLPRPHRAAASRTIKKFRADAEAAGVPLEVLGDMDTYPLHPLVPPVAAALAGRLGQHDRSLGAFIASGAPNTLRWILGRTEASARRPTVIGLDAAYDYFVTAASLRDLQAGGERYREIHDRILEADRLNELEFAILKTIGALNLAGARDLRASPDLLNVVMQDRVGNRGEVDDGLRSLVGSGLITYRRFADEYRVWEGSDFDIAARVDQRREQLRAAEPPRDLLLRLAQTREPARPVIARRHSHQKATLRFFEARYASTLEELDSALDPQSDGILVYLLGERPPVFAAETEDGRPIVILVAGALEQAERSALELAATLDAAQHSPELERDSVARGEMRHRLIGAQQSFAAALREVFDPARRDVSVVAAGEVVSTTAGQGAIERLLSDLCDRAYPRTPVLNSEMLNRRELTSQGAKARRSLIGAMFEHAGDELLGFSGYGPEMAMLGSALTATGLYRDRGDGHSFGPPPKRSPFSHAWAAVMKVFDEADGRALGIEQVYARLQGPPFGMKSGSLPVLIAAAILYRDEDILLFEAGSYVPRIGPEHIERLIKTPERFSVKRLPADSLREEVLVELTKAVGAASTESTDPRNRGALTVLRPMISIVRGLSDYARSTERITTMAQAVRRALLETREPDELLFVDLPQACEVEPLRGELPSQLTRLYASRLGDSLLELLDAQPALTRHIESTLADAFQIDVTRLRGGLAEQTAGVERHVIEPKLRSFVLLSQERGMDDADWLEAIAMNLVDRPPESWSDSDIPTFEALAAERARWVRRLRLLFREGEAGENAAARLTLTLSDGREASRLLEVPAELRESVASAIDEILSELRAEHGAEAPVAALALLAERLLEAEADGQLAIEGT